jgi:hypothetical protein
VRFDTRAIPQFSKISVEASISLPCSPESATGPYPKPDESSFSFIKVHFDRLCGLVVRVLGYRSGGPGSIPGTTRKKSNGSGTESTQPREYN